MNRKHTHALTKASREIERRPWYQFVVPGNKRNIADEIDYPCHKSIMISKSEIHLMTLDFSGNIQDWSDL